MATRPVNAAAGVRRLGAAGAAVTVATMLTNLLAYLVPMLGARQLTAADLGALATVLAIGAIAGVPSLGLQIAIAVHRAQHGAAPTGRIALAAAGLTCAALVVAAPVITVTLRLPVVGVALLAALTVAVVLSGRWLGELQGDQRFVRLAAGMTLLAVVRYGGIIAGLLLGVGLVGSLLLGVLVAFLTLPALAWLAAGQHPVPTSAGATGVGMAPAAAVAPAAGSAPAAGEAAAGVAPAAAVAGGGPVRLDAKRVMAACSATLAMLAVSYADLLLARQLLSAAESGAYAVGSVLTKGALWAPQVVTVLALPRLARGDARTRATALALVAASGAVLVSAAAFGGELAFSLAGGTDYVHLAGYAPFFAATGALYAIAFVLVNAQVAAGAKWPAAPLWIGVVGLVAGALLFAPRTIAGVLGSAVITAAVTIALMAWAARRTPASPLAAPTTAPADSEVKISS